MFVCLLSQVTASTAGPWGLQRHCTRRRRQQQLCPDVQQLQQQQHQPTDDDFKFSEEPDFCSDHVLGIKQHQAAADDLPEQLLHVKLRVLSSSSTAGTFSSSFCSRNSSLTGNVLGRLSTDGQQPVLQPQQPCTAPGHPPPAQCMNIQQQPHGAEQAQHHAALPDPLNASAALPAGQQEEDVSAQKAAAQVLFAEQQKMQAAGSKPSTYFAPEVLQQEQARLMQQGFQTRLFASMLLCNLLCCLVVMAAKVRQVGVSTSQHGSARTAGQHSAQRCTLNLHACSRWCAQVGLANACALLAAAARVQPYAISGC